MTFKSELDFESELVKLLTQRGWEKEILKNKSEDELIQNWADILFENNRSIDRLGDYRLTKTEMQQIIDKIKQEKTPFRLNSFINGKTISIKRDNPEDKNHYGKEISLKIYDRMEISAGQSRYQIAEQPKFFTNKELGHERRGDLMLLINGMPLFHIELKRSGVPVSQAYNQIEKYAKEGCFSGLFGLVQLFVAMTPEEMVYFANPGPDGKFNKNFYFHWADSKNNPVNDWTDIANKFLSIPMAHQLIGFYTIPDASDEQLKVLRSYQYYAVTAISEKVSRLNDRWGQNNLRGGYIWHTTGSGKTMTSFKAAQLIANSGDADKVIFLTDRIELGTQSYNEYKNFTGIVEDDIDSDDSSLVKKTRSTADLIHKIKSDNGPSLIVTSIQKMSNIKEESTNKNDIEIMNNKRIVFIIDECHRSTFGEMLYTIKNTFPRAVFFGFTGTPIIKENQKKNSTTTDVFGDELHRYSISDGIRDKNVLAFDTYRVLTFKESDLRREIGLRKAGVSDLSELLNNEKASEIFYAFQNSDIVPMASYIEGPTLVKGIEDFISDDLYDSPLEEDIENEHTHKNSVIKNILENWEVLSRNNKYHAILATSSIQEAIKYYKLFKIKMKQDSRLPQLKIACLFDPNIDNDNADKSIKKEDAMIEMLKDYNNQFETSFTLPAWPNYKKDVSFRLAHKDFYSFVEKDKAKQIDLLIVVDQMLTGFDSKWINTLYLDKVLEFQNLVQAFSRTNRLNSADKPFGVIKYYRRPFTMEKNIYEAFKAYSGNNERGIFVDKLGENIININNSFEEIKRIFENDNVYNFERNVSGLIEKVKFVKEFNRLWELLEAAKIQGFNWKEKEYHIVEDNETKTVYSNLDEQKFNILHMRYKELVSSGKTKLYELENNAYDLSSTIIEIDTGKIDFEYLNNEFKKYSDAHLEKANTDEEFIQKCINRLINSFNSLSAQDQVYANRIVADVQSGTLQVQPGKDLIDYINEYKQEEKELRIKTFCTKTGIDENQLRKLLEEKRDNSSLNEFGRLDRIIETANKEKAKEYIETKENRTIEPKIVNRKLRILVEKFVSEEDFSI
ncbi:type I restriction endonuclease subunit R [Metamycoplasma neophronis]|uniref:type I site-specific deoxyribonuclease n=1 Tax=Metamycoplasma neophronis TaxID=872983 RepID=A0ABY2YZ65_9BACT|nr:DEAD/DEAH box helicase family protein [Metamycoplasma neophronis]TPR53203.1 type I restriction endonuclease subunit R [Metamycoplasma neophronis]